MTDNEYYQDLFTIVLPKAMLYLVLRTQRCTMWWPQVINILSCGFKVHWPIAAAKRKSRKKNISGQNKIPSMCFLEGWGFDTAGTDQCSRKSSISRGNSQGMLPRGAAQDTDGNCEDHSLEITEAFFWLWLLHFSHCPQTIIIVFSLKKKVSEVENALFCSELEKNKRHLGVEKLCK